MPSITFFARDPNARVRARASTAAERLTEPCLHLLCNSSHVLCHGVFSVWTRGRMLAGSVCRIRLRADERARSEQDVLVVTRRFVLLHV